MKRTRATTALPRLSRDAEHLAMLARGLGASGSRVEDSYWEALLESELSRLLEHGADAALDNALDHLFSTLPTAYDVLMEAAENHAESMLLEHEGNSFQALLITAPILAWSKYAIPSGPLHAELLQSLQNHLRAHIAASRTQIALLPSLYSIEQLPRNFSETRALTHSLAEQALGGKKAPKIKKLADTAPLLADTRYLLAVLVAPQGAPLFQWQEEITHALPHRGHVKLKPDAREQALEQWRTQAKPDLVTTMTGCVFELQLPDAFHAACRESDRAIRPYSLKAALVFLETALKVEPKQLRAVLGLFGNERPEEYRVGFTKLKNPDVVHGAIWPLFGMEEGLAPVEVAEQIEKLLRENGITEVITHEQPFPMEFCDDCGAPMFADPVADLVHAELPEDTEMPSVQHLH